MTYLFYGLIAAAIIFMLYGLYLVFKLRQIATGGQIGRVVNLLAVFILLFMGGYLAAPFMPMLPSSIALTLVGTIFFFGAVYVVIVLLLITRLVTQVFETLDLDGSST